MFHPNPRVPALVLHPVETVKTVAEVVTFLTRDLSCSMTGHDVVRSEGGDVLCLHCLKRCIVEKDRVRWVA